MPPYWSTRSAIPTSRSASWTGVHVLIEAKVALDIGSFRDSSDPSLRNSIPSPELRTLIRWPFTKP